MYWSTLYNLDQIDLKTIRGPNCGAHTITLFKILGYKLMHYSRYYNRWLALEMDRL